MTTAPNESRHDANEGGVEHDARRAHLRPLALDEEQVSRDRRRANSGGRKGHPGTDRPPDCRLGRTVGDQVFRRGVGEPRRWMTHVMKFEALSLRRCQSRFRDPSATRRSRHPEHSSRRECGLHSSRHCFSSSSNLSPEATAVGSTGCVASVFRRFGYSRRASAPRSAI